MAVMAMRLIVDIAAKAPTAVRALTSVGFDADVESGPALSAHRRRRPAHSARDRMATVGRAC